MTSSRTRNGTSISRREVMKRIADSLELVHDTFGVDTEELHRRFVDRRAVLNEHSNRLHAKRQPFDLSVFELESALLALGCDVSSRTRWRGPDLERLNRDAAREIETLLTELAGFEDLILSTSKSPWSRALVTNRSNAEKALDVIAGFSVATTEPLCGGRRQPGTRCVDSS
jgi:hypothetical protein